MSRKDHIVSLHSKVFPDFDYIPGRSKRSDGCNLLRFEYCAVLLDVLLKCLKKAFTTTLAYDLPQ